MKQEIKPGAADDQGQPPADSAAEVERLLNVWRRENGARKVDDRVLLRPLLLAAMVEGVLCLAIQYYRWHGGSPEIARQLAIWNFRLGVPFVFGSILYGLRKAHISARPREQLTPTQVQIAASLNELNDVRTIVALLDARHATEPLREIVFTALTRLLSTTNTAEVASILRPHVGKLYNLLDNEMAASHPDLVISILRVLPCLADQVGLVCLARFIVRNAPTRNEQRVRAAAREILPQLLAQVDFGGTGRLAHWINSLPLTMQGTHRTSPENPLWTDEEVFWTPANVLLPTLAIIQLLPQLTPSDYLALSQKERQLIYANLRWLQMPRLRVDFALVVLDMIRRSVDIDAFAILQGLIDSHYTYSDPRVREAARACIPVLETAIEKEKVSKMLLRGASAPETSPDTLLRAASGNSSTDPQLLLRANVTDSTI